MGETERQRCTQTERDEAEQRGGRQTDKWGETEGKREERQIVGARHTYRETDRQARER